MEELLKYKRKLLITLGIISILALVTIFTVFAGASSGISKITVITLVLIIAIMVFELAMTGNKTLEKAVDKQKINAEKTINEIEEIEKAVEQKMKEADELEGLNLVRLQKELRDNNNWETFGTQLLQLLASQLDIVLGLVYSKAENKFVPIARYAYYSETEPQSFTEGEGLNGQVVKDRKTMHIENIPEGYTRIVSGLGGHQPKEIAIVPLIKHDEVVGLIEFATFRPLGENFDKKLERLVHDIGSLTPAIDKLD